MKKTYLILLLAIGTLHIAHAQASAQESHKLYTLDSAEKVERDRIKISQGDWEFEGGLGLGYSKFSGINYTLGLKARHFLLDRFSLGIVASHEAFGQSSIQRLGLSSRVYFAKFEKWALSFNQEVYLRKQKLSYPFTSSSTANLEGSSGIGAHWFLTPGISLGAHLDAVYNLEPSSEGATRDLRSSFSVTFGF